VKPKVLIVDDSVTVRMDLKEALEEAGFETALCATAASARDTLSRQGFDLIVLDVVLPDADGVELLAELKSAPQTQGVPVMLLSSEDEVRDRVRGMKTGADEYLGKPYLQSQVLSRARELLLRSKGAAGGMLGPRRILTVDDSPSYLQVLSEELRQEGFDVVCAESGVEALELLAVQSVDAILLDCQMPELSGRETCLRIKASPAWRDIPLLMLTALQKQEAMIESINAGADDYITKSENFDELKARLRSQLRRRQFEDENRLFREQLLRREMEALEVQAVRELAESRAAHISDLSGKNEELMRARDEAEALTKELESFSYSVSHDLRSPLRSIDGFARALQEDCAPQLDELGMRYLNKVCAATRRMERLIDDMLALARVSRKELVVQDIDLSALAGQVGEELQAQAGGAKVALTIQQGLKVRGDLGLLRILLENLMGNAWKFSSKSENPRVELSAAAGEGPKAVYTLRDNGAGFDMAYADKLFGAFQRLHSSEEFKGTGIGLATVQRIIRRHGGAIWAEGRPGQGAAFHFSL
jgi:two-component system NtrC family sensor kinase